MSKKLSGCRSQDEPLVETWDGKQLRFETQGRPNVNVQRRNADCETVRLTRRMRAYLQSRLVKIGLGLLVVGTGPLVFVVAAVALGLWPDPNPNPIGPGLLSFFTFWPAVICIVVGVIRHVRDQGRSQGH